MKNKKQLIFILLLSVVVFVVSYFVFRPKVIVVELTTVSRGEFVEEIYADGFFRAKNRYIVTAFAEGDIKRVDLRVGDPLKKNQLITQLYWDVKYVPVRSPMSGVVSKVFRESAGPIHRGDPIIEIIDPAHLEIVTELLTTDAARVKVGNPAKATGWGEEQTISAIVTKISKAGFSKISALGVEEERTEVIMEPLGLSVEAIGKLGHLFHTQVVIQISKNASVLKIPIGALLRQGNSWAVYQVIKGKAQLKTVKLFLRGNEEVVIAEGLKEGDLVINYPGDLIKSGVSVSGK